MTQPRTMTSIGLSVLPLLLMGVSHLSLPPLRAMFEVEPRLMYAWYAVAVGLGVVLLRRSRVVKDHEYNRAKAMKKIRHVYEAEERGVWETDAHLDATMDANAKANMVRRIGDFSGEGAEMELGDDQVEVQMLSEAAHVVKANARVSGEVTFEDESNAGTVGATRQRSPMDRFLDGVWSLFGRDARAEREERRRQRLTRAAIQAPVVAQRPVAPLQLNKSDDTGEVNMVSMSDEGGVETVISTSGQEKEVPALNRGSLSVPSESLESMAMMGQAPTAATSFATAGPRCRGCQAPVQANERFCPHCGLDL
jgi:hypothetical protein